MAKKVIPSIHIPIQDKDGSMSLPWYLFLKWIVDNSGDIDEIQEEIDDLQDTKVDKTSDAEKLYGTDENGDQTTYDIDSLIPDVNLDNVTVNKNASDQIQAIGVKNKNGATGATSTIYDWVGTLAEYNAQNIATEHPDWVCYITDDVNPDTTYTKAEADALFVRKTGNYNESVNGIKNFIDALGVRHGQLAPSTNTVKTSRIIDTYMQGTKNTSNKNDGFQIFRDQNTSGDREIVYGSTFLKSDGTTSTWAELSLGITPNDLVFGRLRNTGDIPVNNNGNYLVTTRHLIRVLATIYPIGSIFITEANSCPLASLFGTWTLVSDANGRALWGGSGSNGGTTIAAGAPNISGTVTFETLGDRMTDFGATGAFTFNRQAGIANDSWDHGGNYGIRNTIGINATRSSSVYGGSSTIQPPAYRVNVWKRTA